jgi:hypothetical protein
MLLWPTLTLSLPPQHAQSAVPRLLHHTTSRSLLSEIIPTLSTRVNGTVGMHLGDWDLFSPAISCPPGRPLKRYGKGEGEREGGVVCVVCALWCGVHVSCVSKGRGPCAAQFSSAPHYRADDPHR